jgi:nitrile hydratase subunit beta
MVLLGSPERRLIRVDELRRNIEALPPDAYDKMTYYERWVTSIANTLLQRGVVTSDELGRKMADVAQRQSAE